MAVAVVMSVVVSVVVSMIVTVVVSVIVSSVIVTVVMSVIMSVIVCAVVVSVSTTAFTGRMVMLTTEMVMAFARVQNLNEDQVEAEGKDCDDQHVFADNLSRFHESHSSFSEEPDSHNPDGGNGNKCSDNFSASPTI